MGRKPVLAVAGTLITSLALAGCQTTTTKDPFMPNATKMQSPSGQTSGNSNDAEFRPYLRRLSWVRQMAARWGQAAALKRRA